MRVLVLTAEGRAPDLSTVFATLPSYLDVDVRVLNKAQQKRLRRYLADIDLSVYQRILLDLPFKHMVTQAALLARLPGLLIYEEDACQNYLAASKWRGAFSRFYRQLPAARVVVTGASVAQQLHAEGFNVTFLPKGYDSRTLFDEQQPRDIELGFIGRTASRAYAGRKEMLDSLAAVEPLQLLRTTGACSTAFAISSAPMSAWASTWPRTSRPWPAAAYCWPGARAAKRKPSGLSMAST
jgi:hypothetical protein